MATVAELRAQANIYLHRVDSSTVPWTAAELDQLVADVLRKTWPKLGIWTFGDVDTSSTGQLYAVPAEFSDRFQLSRIDVLDSTDIYLDRVKNWRKHDDQTVLIKPLMRSGSTLRFYGWVPFEVNGSDLPEDLEETIAHRVAARAYTNLAAELLNSERQQNLDSGRIVSYSDAIGFAAAHERLYEEGVAEHPNRVNIGPRRSTRR